jgi:hypothetical protein
MTPTPFLHFCYYLPFEEDLAISFFTNFNSIHPRMIEFGLLVLEKKILINVSVYFYSFAIISPWRRVIPFI